MQQEKGSLGLIVRKRLFTSKVQSSWGEYKCPLAFPQTKLLVFLPIASQICFAYVENMCLYVYLSNETSTFTSGSYSNIILEWWTYISQKNSDQS